MTDWLVPIGFGVVASLATVGGGVLAYRLADRSSLILAAAAGIVLGVAFFDLIPEALDHGEAYDPHVLLGCTAAGFAAYLLLNRVLASAEGRARFQAHLGPASLTMHSLFDGILMGVAFQIAPAVGLTVALAVLMHDVADGLNTVSMAMADRRSTAKAWLLVNGAAPLTGVLVGLSVRLDGAVLAPLMAFFAGLFLYIGACELVPRSLLRDGRLRTTGAILGGMALMLGVTEWAHG